MTLALRTGSSLIKTINDAPTALLLKLGFTEEQAARMVSARRVLPLVEDCEAPCIDARKLWERIGKPWGKFASWMESEARTFSVFMEKGQARQFATPTKGRPRVDYLLSRDCAMHLAMMADTQEGHFIRSYLLDMERLAAQLSAYMPVRADQIVSTDRAVTHLTIQRAGDRVKAGTIQKPMLRPVALDMEKKIKAATCEALTGHLPGHWRETFGRGVRDVLAPADLATYANAYEAARVMVSAGLAKTVDGLKLALSKAYGEPISFDKYVKNGPASAAALADVSDF